MLRYNAFGRLIGVAATDEGWVAYDLGADGKRRTARDITIPRWIEKEEVLRFLADLLHESASPDTPDVIFLGDASDPFSA